ncbi:hypothetical protein BCR44DRAFT_92726 [Catenaria anguillulae PL171]|uniref:Uncharacterized protein n=1 Tax=Catenaria anguillulae PL171 TaxID=765915 RepID=A0A1Y2HS85_9FUNG|nr:hypothetical protein BCR44DRAFT_92726 [Catenaria anguillulae PL171]
MTVSLDAADCWTFSTGIPKSLKRTCLVFGLPSAYTLVTCAVLLHQGCDLVLAGLNVSDPKFVAILAGKASHGQTIVHYDLPSHRFQLSDAYALSKAMLESGLSSPAVAFTICDLAMHQTLLSDPRIASSLNLSRIISIIANHVPTVLQSQSSATSINKYNPRGQLSLPPTATKAIANMHIPSQIGVATIAVIQVTAPASELIMDSLAHNQVVHPMLDQSPATVFAEAIATALEGGQVRRGDHGRQLSAHL